MYLQGQLCVLAERPGCFGTCLNSCDTVTRPSVTTSVFFDRLTLLVATILAMAPLLCCLLWSWQKTCVLKPKCLFLWAGCSPRLVIAQLWYTRLSRREMLLCLVLEFVFLLNRSAVSSFWLAWEGPAELCSVWGRRDTAEDQHPAKWLCKEGKKKQVFMLILAAVLPNVVPGSYRRSQNKAQL